MEDLYFLIFIAHDDNKRGLMRYILISMLCLLSSCTFSVNLVHTEGVASDVVDETQTPSTTVTPTVNIPAEL